MLAARVTAADAALVQALDANRLTAYRTTAHVGPTQTAIDPLAVDALLLEQALGVRQMAAGAELQAGAWPSADVAHERFDAEEQRVIDHRPPDRGRAVLDQHIQRQLGLADQLGRDQFQVDPQAVTGLGIGQLGLPLGLHAGQLSHQRALALLLCPLQAPLQVAFQVIVVLLEASPIQLQIARGPLLHAVDAFGHGLESCRLPALQQPGQGCRPERIFLLDPPGRGYWQAFEIALGLQRRPLADGLPIDGPAGLDIERDDLQVFVLVVADQSRLEGQPQVMAEPGPLLCPGRGAETGVGKAEGLLGQPGEPALVEAHAVDERLAWRRLATCQIHQAVDQGVASRQIQPAVILGRADLVEHDVLEGGRIEARRQLVGQHDLVGAKAGRLGDGPVQPVEIEHEFAQLAHAPKSSPNRVSS